MLLGLRGTSASFSRGNPRFRLGGVSPLVLFIGRLVELRRLASWRREVGIKWILAFSFSTFGCDCIPCMDFIVLFLMTLTFRIS